MRTASPVCLVLLLTCLAAAAAEEPKKEPRTERSAAVTCGDTVVEYTVTAARHVMKDDQGKEKAHVFAVSYVAKGDAGPRPLTFAFNGGPGSSSVWLHMGGLGPRRVVMEPEGWAPKPPYRYVENDDCWLAFTDLVFVDPVSTGFSRAAKGESPKQFHGLHEDARSVADFIRQWITQNHRWGSPVYLVGESYGTTRAAELSGQLAGRGIDLSGIVLVSPVLNFQTTGYAVGNDLPYWLYLPSLAATARFHGKVETDRPLAEWLDEVEAFAETDYLLALAKGDRLPAADRERTAERVAAYTGLGKEFVLRSDLRVSNGEFQKELLRAEGFTVGRLDSRFKGIDRRDVGSHPESDPSMDAIRGPFTAALNDYLRRDLLYPSDLVYEIFGNVHPWKMERHDNRYVNVAETLRRTMAAHPALRVLVAMGYYDFATPYYAAEYTVSHMQLPPERRKNITFAHYESGHMMYIRDADRRKLTADAAAFYRTEER